MEKTKVELLAELSDLQQKYKAFESKFLEETNKFAKLEEELRMKLMFLEGVANSTIDGFLVVNPYGQKILQNKRTVELWKIPQEIVDDPDGLKQVGHVMKMAINPKQFVSEIDYLREHPDDKSRDEIELIDGTILDRYSSPVIGPDGINYGRIWTFHDVTDRKKAEKQLIQLNADKDRFISILSHDLKSPFSSLLGLSELLRRKLSTFSVEKTEKMVDAINLSAQKIYKLLEDTLMWANVRSNILTYNPSNNNIFEIVSEVASLLEPIAISKKIKISHTIDKEMIVYADIYMLKAILRNLVSNAIKFTNIGGKIEILAIHHLSNVEISIHDNGIGISPENMDKLFNISTINSSLGTANEAGTGLGLLLCKEFVDKHGGKIWIDKSIKIGTKVNFTIPALLE